MGLRGLASFEELHSTGHGVIEDAKDKLEHHLLDLGDQEGLGWRNELEGTMHQMGVPLGHEFDPGNSRSRRRTLSGHHKRDKPACVEVPARPKCLKTKLLRSGRGMLGLCSLRGGDSRSGRIHNPRPNGSG